VKAKSKAPDIMTPFAEYLVKTPPTRNLEANDEALRIPMSVPISLSFEPDFARKIGMVGYRAKKSD
jgi:hypothetical protein